VAVGAIVWRDSKVLLVRRARPPRAGQWSIPGGRQELGETVSEAACREVAEETGVSVEVLDVVSAIDFIDRDEAGQVRFHYVLVDVVAEWTAGEPRAGDDAVEVGWFALDELLQLELWSETVRVIQMAAERRTKSLS
jgi:ADP-ribose pyrophosphatase YjhB (NUDIX family)